jgi:hypothetical protein
VNDPEQLPRVQEWKEFYPREGWALDELHEHDPLRSRVYAAILQNRDEDPAIDDLVRFADALEARQNAVSDGTMKSAPPVKYRRAYDVRVVRMKHVSHEDSPYFRIDFTTREGWSGFFDTENPLVVEQVNKHKGPQPLTVVGEVVKRPYDFMVKLGGPIRIV